MKEERNVSLGAKEGARIGERVVVDEPAVVGEQSVALNWEGGRWHTLLDSPSRICYRVRLPNSTLPGIYTFLRPTDSLIMPVRMLGI